MVTTYDAIPQLTRESLTPCNYMCHSLVKLTTTPTQIPEATQGLLYFDGEMDQYSSGSTRVPPISIPCD
jgi:hypothetical protein